MIAPSVGSCVDHGGERHPARVLAHPRRAVDRRLADAATTTAAGDLVPEPVLAAVGLAVERRLLDAAAGAAAARRKRVGKTFAASCAALVRMPSPVASGGSSVGTQSATRSAWLMA